jgi:hypothetical protein
VRIARAWGISPAAAGELTIEELLAMAQVMEQESEARK